MALGTLIGTHGYWVLALGCLLEGETILLLAGFTAHRGAGGDRNDTAAGAALNALDPLGALLWAYAIAGIGWLFGQAAQAVLGEVRHLWKVGCCSAWRALRRSHGGSGGTGRTDRDRALAPMAMGRRQR